MNPLSSLTNRVFLAGAVLVVAATSLAVYRVNASVEDRAETDLRTGLAEAASLVDQISRTDFQDFIVKGQLIADLPVLKGAAATGDPPTVQPIAREYQIRIGADLLVVADRTGRPLAVAGRLGLDEAAIREIVSAGRLLRDGTLFWPLESHLLHVAVIPFDEGIGTLILGVALDERAAAAIKNLTSSDIAFASGNRIIASTLDAGRSAALGQVAGRRDVFTIPIGGETYIGRVQPLGAADDFDSPVALVLRSRTERLKFLTRLRWQIAVTGVIVMCVATLAAYLVARTVTRPLRALTGTMRAMAETGDLARALPPLGRWDDEDVRLVATTFHQLTSALDRFQREAAQRERLSSLGRLSAVVAHEIRNPLMIIKSAARTLRRVASRDTPEIEQATHSIDEEVGRLNNVVSGVLDFARPIAFAIEPADLGDICRAAIRAVTPGAEGVVPVLEGGGSALPIVTDAERVRSVLVNVLSNAIQAVRSRGDSTATAGAPIVVSVGKTDEHWTIRVRDAGIGMSPAEVSRMFDPFFTTKPGGTGLGLAISRNIIEGLGGAIGAESAPGEGTTVTITLPDRQATGGPA